MYANSKAAILHLLIIFIVCWNTYSCVSIEVHWKISWWDMMSVCTLEYICMTRGNLARLEYVNHIALQSAMAIYVGHQYLRSWLSTHNKHTFPDMAWPPSLACTCINTASKQAFILNVSTYIPCCSTTFVEAKRCWLRLSFPSMNPQVKVTPIMMEEGLNSDPPASSGLDSRGNSPRRLKASDVLKVTKWSRSSGAKE